MRELLEVKKEGRNRAHSVIVDNRERISVTGVADVLSFNETEIELESDSGGMTIFGQNLHISKLNLEEGQLVVDGFIEGFEYAELAGSKGGLFSRLFK